MNHEAGLKQGRVRPIYNRSINDLPMYVNFHGFLHCS